MGLIDCFREDARTLGVPLRVIATDMLPALSAACRDADKSFMVPRCTDPAYKNIMLDICREEKIDLLIPCIDPELEIYSRSASEFEKVGTSVVVSSPSVITLARDKLATAMRLESIGIGVPKTVLLEDYLLNPSCIPGPIIAKPISGSASIGIVRGESVDDLSSLPVKDYIVQELWCGSEYTVNMYFDKSGICRCIVPHLRLEVRAGEVSKGRSEKVPILDVAAARIAQLLPGVRGPICFQAIVRKSGSYAIFEINARFGGGYPLAHRAGARFSRWLLEEVSELESTAENKWEEGVLMLRYDSALFINE